MIGTSYALLRQADGRAYRKGQTHSVDSYKMYTIGSMDERMLNSFAKRDALIRTLLGPARLEEIWTVDCLLQYQLNEPITEEQLAQLADLLSPQRSQTGRLFMGEYIHRRPSFPDLTPTCAELVREEIRQTITARSSPQQNAIISAVVTPVQNNLKERRALSCLLLTKFMTVDGATKVFLVNERGSLRGSDEVVEKARKLIHALQQALIRHLYQAEVRFLCHFEFPPSWRAAIFTFYPLLCRDSGTR